MSLINLFYIIILWNKEEFENGKCPYVSDNVFYRTIEGDTSWWLGSYIDHNFHTDRVPSIFCSDVYMYMALELAFHCLFSFIVHVSVYCSHTVCIWCIWSQCMLLTFKVLIQLDVDILFWARFNMGGCVFMTSYYTDLPTDLHCRHAMSRFNLYSYTSSILHKNFIYHLNQYCHFYSTWKIKISFSNVNLVYDCVHLRRNTKWLWFWSW